MSGALVWRLETAGNVVAVAFSPDGQQALTFTFDGESSELWRWELDQQPPTSRSVLRSAGGGPAMISPDGNHALTWWQWWDLAGEKPTPRPLPSPAGTIAALSLSRGGHAVTGGSFRGPDWRTSAEVLWWDLEGKEAAVRPLSGASLPVDAVAISPDGRRALTSGGAFQAFPNPFAGPGSAGRVLPPAELLWWDLQSDPPSARPLPYPSTPVRAMALSPDGRHAITSGWHSSLEEQEVLWWDLAVEDGAARRLTGTSQPMTAMAFSPGGRRALTNGGPFGEELLYWDLGGDVPTARTLPGPKGRVVAVAFSPDGRHAITGGDYIHGELLVWDLADDTAIAQPLPVDGAGVMELAISPDGRRAITGRRQISQPAWQRAVVETRRGHPLHLAAGGPARAADGRGLHPGRAARLDLGRGRTGALVVGHHRSGTLRPTGAPRRGDGLH